jgi:hypothetical protein
MKVRAQRGTAVESLNEGDAAALPVGMASLVSVIRLQLVTEHAQEALAERVVVGDAVTPAVRNREHPLSDRYARDDMVDQVRGRLGHAPTATPRAKSSSLARQADRVVAGAVAAVQANQAARQHSTVEERAQFLFHEPWHARRVVVRGGGLQERGKMGVQDFVEHAVLGLAVLIRSVRDTSSALGAQAGCRLAASRHRGAASQLSRRVVRASAVAQLRGVSVARRLPSAGGRHPVAAYGRRMEAHEKSSAGVGTLWGWRAGAPAASGDRRAVSRLARARRCSCWRQLRSRGGQGSGEGSLSVSSRSQPELRAGRLHPFLRSAMIAMNHREALASGLVHDGCIVCAVLLRLGHEAGAQ